MRRPTLKLGRLVYKHAGWQDWVAIIANALVSVAYKLHFSKEQLISWLAKIGKKKQAARPIDDDIPDDLVSMLAEAMSSAPVPSGDFIQALIRRLDDPGPGYRWKRDSSGSTYLVKQKHGPKSTERPLSRGSRFLDKAFVGAWWYTDNGSSPNHRKLQSLLKKAGGGIFHKTRTGLGFTEYYGYAIVPTEEAPSLGSNLFFAAEDLKAEEGDRDYRLSAIGLDSLAANKPVVGHDVITLTGIFLSQKYNWEYNLPDLINGRLKDTSINAAVKRLLSSYGK